MKILLVTHYYPAHGGGVEIIAGQLAGRFTRLRDDVEILWAASATDKTPGGLGRVSFLPMGALNFTETFLGVPYPIWGIASIVRLRRAVQVADAVHLHDCLYFGNLLAFFFARLYKKPVVVTQHIGFVPYKNSFLKKLLSFLNRTLGKYVLKNAHRVVFYSDEVRKYFDRFVRFKREPLFIPNGVDMEVFHPVDDEKRKEIRARLDLPEEGPLLLFVGRFVEKKGMHILRRLVPLLPRVQWAFVGWGPLDPETWGYPNLKVFKKLEHAKIAPFYQAADLLVLPSQGEGFPLVVQEAMACGTPAMVGPETARAHPGVLELVFSAPVGGGEFAERWAEKISELLEKPSLIAGLRPQVARFAAERWNWDVCAKGYIEEFMGYQKWSRQTGPL